MITLVKWLFLYQPWTEIRRVGLSCLYFQNHPRVNTPKEKSAWRWGKLNHEKEPAGHLSYLTPFQLWSVVIQSHVLRASLGHVPLLLYAYCSDDYCLRGGGGREKPEFLENPDIQWWQMMEGQTPACPPSPEWSSTVNAHSWILHTYLQVVINGVLMWIYVSIKFHHIHRYRLHRAWHLIT